MREKLNMMTDIRPKRVDFKVRGHFYSFYYQTQEQFCDAILDLADSDDSDLCLMDCLMVIKKLGDRAKA